MEFLDILRPYCVPLDNEIFNCERSEPRFQKKEFGYFFKIDARRFDENFGCLEFLFDIQGFDENFRCLEFPFDFQRFDEFSV